MKQPLPGYNRFMSLSTLAATSTAGRSRFLGQIAGVGSTSGVRIVVGNWADSPLGSFADAMVELPGGHRILLAPSGAVANFIAATYSFDEIRVEPFDLTEQGSTWSIRSASLHLDFEVGSRTWLGALLRLVPQGLAHAPRWISLIDLIARVVLRGVRVAGETKNGRKEWYGATDNRVVTSLAGTFDGRDLGVLSKVEPSPRFGFSSTPPRPSVTRICTTVEVPTEGN